MVPIFYNLPILFATIRDEYPELGIDPDDRETMIPTAVNFLKDLWVSQTYATNDMMIDAAREYYGKTNITKKELDEWINLRVFQDRRRLSYDSNNNTIQVTKNFQKNGHIKLMEAFDLLED